MKDQKALDKILAARFLISDSVARYYSKTLFSLIPIEKPGMGTIGVDKYFRLYYDPETVNNWTVQDLVPILMHECGHLVRGHHKRFESLPGKHHMVANIAGDCEINDDLVKEGHGLPEFTDSKGNKVGSAVHPKQFKLPEDKMLEFYYNELMKKAPPKMQVGIMGGKCGSCAGNAVEGEEGAPNGENAPGLEEGESDLVVRGTLNDIAKGIGNAPDSLKRLAESMLKSTVPWQKVLGRIVRNSIHEILGQEDYSYKRINRRSPSGVLMPVMRGFVPSIAIIGDTSGSMDQKALESVIAETGKIIESCGYRDGVPFYSVDAAVGGRMKVFSPRDVKLTGGGGTDMRIGIDAALSAKPKPQLVIVMSDCYTPWPELPLNGAKLVIARINSKADCPAWATVVDVEN
jgi:predicted metal-dependent peptidase